MDKQKLKSAIESLLFVSGEPISTARLAKMTGCKKPEIDEAIATLAGECETQGRGVGLIRNGDEVQMASNPENAVFVDKLIKGELQESLSSAALEVISIIAYRGPISRANIESIRGVNCSFTIRNLLMRGLVERLDNPSDSRSYLYSISFDFLKKLGIENVTDLPEYDTLSKDERVESVVGDLTAGSPGHKQ